MSAVHIPTGSSFKVLKKTSPPKRIIMSVEGLERQGKTHFALTAPGPIAFMQMDPGSDDVLPKFTGLNKDIMHSSYWVDVKPGTSREEIAKLADAIWKRSVKDFESALGEVRTIIIDTASEWFVALKLARFGKLTQIMPEDYAPVYAEYKRLLRMAYQHETNVILLHKLKAEYVKEPGKEKQKGGGTKSGLLIKDGFSGTGYEMQMQLRAYREDGQFMLNVLDCRQNPDMEGMDLPAMTFAELAQLVYPDSDESDWT